MEVVMNGWGEFVATQTQQRLEQKQRQEDYEHRQAMTPYDHPHPDLHDVVEIVERWLHLQKKATPPRR
jgi:hypothetical protein